MMVRLVRFGLGEGKGEVARALAADLVPAISARPGCQSVFCFGDDDDGEYGLFVLWDTQENADAAAQVIRPRLEQHLQGNITSPPDARLFDVLGHGP